MSLEEKILKVVAEKQVISLSDLGKKMNMDKNSLNPIITKLKEYGYICTSELLSPATVVITVKGKNSVENKY